MWKEIFRKKIPSIVTQHHLRDNYLRKVQLAVLRKMDRIITVAPIANELTKEGIKKEKIIFIPNGVDIETYKPEKKADYLQQRYNISTDEFIIGTICGLEKRKRVDLLIKAMARLRNENVKLVIGGKGETMNDLRQLARRLNVSKQVVFAGYIKSEEVKDFYNLFDVFTLPSDLEAMPLSILEAMACKKPAISTNIGAIPLEIKHEHNGFIMEKGNLDQLTNYLKIMIKDPNQTKEMGKNSLKMVHEMFTWDICVEKTHEVFKELVEK